MNKLDVLHSKLMVPLTTTLAELLAQHEKDGIVEAFWIGSSQYFPLPQLFLFLFAQWIRPLLPLSHAILSEINGSSIQDLPAAFKLSILLYAEDLSFLSYKMLQRSKHGA